MKLDEIILVLKSSIGTMKSDISSTVSELKKLTSTTSTVTQTMDKVSKTIEPVSNNLNKATTSANNFNKTINDAPKQSYIQLESELKRVKNQYNDLNNVLKLYETSLQGQTPEAMKKTKESPLLTYSSDTGKTTKWADSFADAEEKLESLSQKMNQLRGQISAIQNVGANSLNPLKKSADEAAKSTDNASSKSNNFSKNIRRINKNLSSTTSVSDSVKKAIDNLSKKFGSFNKNVSKGFDRLYFNLKKFGLGLLGIRTAMAFLTKSTQAYISFDSELQASIQNSYQMLGALLAPAIIYVAQAFATAVNYVYQFVTALTGIDLVARANAKALQTQAKATKGAAAAQRGLLAMDEITNLPTEPSGGGGSAPQIEVGQIKPNEFINEMVEALKNGEWHKAGEIVAESINKALGKINWNKIQSGAEEIGTGIALFLNGVFELDWKLLGSTLGNGLQTAIRFAFGFVENFEFARLGNGLGRALNGAFESVDWKMLATTISDGIIGIFNMIHTFFVAADWEQIGEDIKTFLVNIKWKEIAKAVYGAIKAAFVGLSDFIKGLFDVDIDENVLLGVFVALISIKPILAILDKFGKTKDTVKDTAATIGDSFGNMLESLGKATTFIALLGGIALVINSIANLFKSFGDTGMDASEGLLLLGGTITMIVGAFVILSKTVQEIPITALLGFVVVMGMLSLVLISVSKLFETFSNSTLSIGGAIGLLVTVFVGLIAVMAAVALIGPMMTAGLLPFAIVVGLIIATLAVLALTLPTILSAVSDFVTNVAPPVVAILKTIFDGISKLVTILGVTLPPIITALGNVFDTVFNGISTLVETVGNVIVNVMEKAGDIIPKVLGSILNFVNQLGPAINRLVSGIITATTRLINFVIRAMEHLVNITVVPAANSIIEVVNKVPGIKLSKVAKIHIPRLETGTNEIKAEGIYHLHEGEAVVPKKYNPATDGYNDGSDNKQIIDLLIDLNASMIQYAERPININMDSKKVAEATYDNIQMIHNNKNVSGVMTRS